MVCREALELAIPLCQWLGFPVALNKVEGPSTTLVFLGIEIDSVKQELWLPAEKLHRLKEILASCTQRRSATKWQLQQGPVVISDAAGKWGCGAYTRDTLHWFQFPWPPVWALVDISAKELLPIVISSTIWGSSWANNLITFYSDNQTVVSVLG